MAKLDITIVDNAGNQVVPTQVWQTEADSTAINAGEFVKLKTAGSPYVIPLADGEPTIGTTTAIVGLAASDSTHTSDADGTVEVFMILPGVVYAIDAKSAAAADTKSEIDVLCGNTVGIDLTSGKYSIDTTDSSVATKGFMIVGGDPAKSKLYVQLRLAAMDGVIAAS